MEEAFLLSVNKAKWSRQLTSLPSTEITERKLVCTYIYVCYALKFSVSLDESRSLPHEYLFDSSSREFDLRQLVAHIVIRIGSFELSHLLKSIVCDSSPILRGNSSYIGVVLRSLWSVRLGIVRRSDRLLLTSRRNARTWPIESLHSIG